METTKTTTAINKSKLFHIAHAMYRKSQTSTFAEALRLAWKAIKLYAKMKVGRVEFSYTKKDGSVRKAVGTLIGFTYTLKKEPVTDHKNDDVIRYWDVEKNTFRSFKAASLI